MSSSPAPSEESDDSSWVADGLVVLITDVFGLWPRIPCPNTRDLIAHNTSLLRSGKHSDLTIICQNRKWLVHRAIVCRQSSFLGAVMDGSFKVLHDTYLSFKLLNVTRAGSSYLYYIFT